jgi:hypothetical protein
VSVLEKAPRRGDLILLEVGIISWDRPKPSLVIAVRPLNSPRADVSVVSVLYIDGRIYDFYWWEDRSIFDFLSRRAQ